jgi:uncharacterized protein YraI
LKHYLCILLALFAAFSVAPASANSDNQQTGLQTTVAKRLKLRDGPGTQWAILGTLEVGEVVMLDGRAPYVDTIWVRGITPGGRVGWMLGSLLAAPQEQLRGLRKIWVDTPFTLSAPPPAVPPGQVTPPKPLSLNKVITNITSRARQIYRAGQKLGNHANVFSKVGDSITASPYFLLPIGQGKYQLGAYAQLQKVIDYFSAAPARDGRNSFENPSLAAHDGWSTSTVLNPAEAWTQVCQPGETPLACEYRVVKPSVALIMLGTNDMAVNTPDVFKANLSTIVQTTIDNGIIPVLSTIPYHEGYDASVPVFNQVIIDTANAYRIPLWDFHSALEGLPNHGLIDGTHPTPPPGDDVSLAANFSPENLKYGYTLRNLTALYALDAVWRKALR